MTAPVPVTPTEAADAARYAAIRVNAAMDAPEPDDPAALPAHVMWRNRICIDDAPTLARFVAALPAEPAADARLAADRFGTALVEQVNRYSDAFRAVEALCQAALNSESGSYLLHPDAVLAALSGAAPASQPAGEDQ